jgi:hypothetical protein
MVTDRTVDELAEIAAALDAATSFEEGYPLYARKRELEEGLQAAEVMLNRVAHGWTYVAPSDVEFAYGEQPRAADLRAVMPRGARENSRRPVTSGRGAAR